VVIVRGAVVMLKRRGGGEDGGRVGVEVVAQVGCC